MPLTLERIEALAPDQASLAAARKLLKPALWPTLSEGEDLTWGECQGSGATPYRVVVSEVDAGYKCTCPSRKFPCKHTLALMWMRADRSAKFTPAPVPEWVKDWLSRRRGTSSAPGKPKDESKPKDKPSIRRTETAETEAVPDAKAEQRAAATRERNRLEREAAVLAGLDELDVWLLDQAQHGMVNFVAQAAQSCRTISQRLVDAKSSGLAGRLDALPTRLFTLPDRVRPVAAIRELGQIHLISQAYRRAPDLPELLVADARQAVGWSVTREALLNDSGALRVDAKWRVFAVVSEAQPDRLRRVETWLWRESEIDRAPCCAVLVEFVPLAGGSATGGYLVGDQIEAELCFYRSTVPLRAQIATLKNGATQAGAALAPLTETLSVSLSKYEQALATLPWLNTFPLAFRSATLRRTENQLFLHDDENGLSLPLASSQASEALPLASAGRIVGIGLWNGYEFTLAWAETNLGRWVRA
jgi:hypothetical protein